MTQSAGGPPERNSLTSILDRVRAHSFHPLEDDNFTVDRTLGVHGIANLDDDDWRVRLLAVRDLIRLGDEAVPEIARGLRDEDVHVRYVCATALGVLGSRSVVDELESVVRDDPVALARSQAIVALGQVEAVASLELLEETREADPSRDVRHQAELAVDRIEKGFGATEELREAFRTLDSGSFDELSVGARAPSFSLPDTAGETWELADSTVDETWTVLIWVFADWCPVCHTEFTELIELREEFEAANVTVATVECHDGYPCRVMVGEELDPDYWFADTSFQESYTEQIWWPHLVDRAGAVGARYGVNPMAFAVHAEYINRPATILIDPSGVVRFAYYGTYWGDRPSIVETLDMITSGTFEFEHPDRRVLPTE